MGSSHGALILLNVLGINFVSDGLRDALDPYSAKHVRKTDGTLYSVPSDFLNRPQPILLPSQHMPDFDGGNRYCKALRNVHLAPAIHCDSLLR